MDMGDIHLETKPVMAETLDPLSPSVNSAGSRGSLIDCLRVRFGRGTPVSRPSGEGYVEFGDFRPETPGVKKVGTFAGVFCPVVLSMFSALIFIRMGYLIGNAGLIVTLAQFGMAYLIVVFTVTSICAISTNGAVEGGGVYFMISRTLGPEFGGAIGTLFFFANVVSSALCISACTEALVENFGPNGYLVSPGTAGLPDSWWYRFLYRSCLNVCGLCVSLAGAALVARTSLATWAIALVCLASAFISFVVTPAREIDIPDSNHLINATNLSYTGWSLTSLKENLYPQYGRDYTTANGDMVDFAAVFGVLFTGVTGVMAGANMSGELKTPSRSIPLGTLTALAFTAVSYVALSVLTAATCSRALLQNNYVYLLPINVWPPFVAVGMIIVTFSAGLSNLIGASRVLEALAKDNIFGCLLRPMVQTGNPVRAVIVSAILVQLGIAVGSLNAIAQINTVLFMTSYFAVNLACLGLDLASAPNFRPTFKQFSWHTSLLGLVGCSALMFALRPAHAAGAALLAGGLVVALHLLSPAAADPRWGSLSQALIFHQVRKYLLLLDPRRAHVKFWRPQMLLLVASPRQAAPLIDFVNDQKKGGLFVIGHVRVGQLDGADPLAAEQPHWLQLIDHLKVKAFVELSLSTDVRSGAAQLARLAGLGAMKPDTVLLGFRDQAPPRDCFRDPSSPYRTEIFESPIPAFPQRTSAEPQLPATQYVGIVSDVLAVSKNVCLCRHFHKLDMGAVERKSSTLKYIDVWLVDLLRPSRTEPFTVRALFALQLAAVVRSARGWQHLRLRVHAVSRTDPGDSDVQISESGSTRSLPISNLEPRVRRLAASAEIGEVRLKELLNVLRIHAETHTVDEWPALHENGRWADDEEDPYQRVPLSYLQTVNNIIRQRCSEGTAVTFVQLPAPPPRPDTLTAEHYLKVLDEFTKDLPPTILVRGLKSVTSTDI